MLRKSEIDVSRHRRQVESSLANDAAVAGDSTGVSFDKFMDDMFVRRRVQQSGPDTPLRRRAAAHQERPLGRIRFGGTR